MDARWTVSPWIAVLALVAAAAGEEPARPLPTTGEARERARLLHEAMHATLQIVHHEYYREDEGLAIPAATLRKVFKELAERQQVELRWLAVNAQPMNADHQPRSAFEKEAVAALAAGKEEFEQQEGGMYRLASAITLTSDCLKCHAPNRKDTNNRSAALVIALKAKDE